MKINNTHMIEAASIAAMVTIGAYLSRNESVQKIIPTNLHNSTDWGATKIIIKVATPVIFMSFYLKNRFEIPPFQRYAIGLCAALPLVAPSKLQSQQDGDIFEEIVSLGTEYYGRIRATMGIFALVVGVDCILSTVKIITLVGRIVLGRR